MDNSPSFELALASLTPVGLHLERRHITMDGDLHIIDLHAAGWAALDDIAALEGMSPEVLVHTIWAREPTMALPTALELFCIRYWRDRLAKPDARRAIS